MALSKEELADVQRVTIFSNCGAIVQLNGHFAQKIANAVHSATGISIAAKSRASINIKRLDLAQIDMFITDTNRDTGEIVLTVDQKQFLED